MGFEDYISETEAAAFSGVSPATLNRFAEAGYLRIESDADGLRLFSKSELKNVFGLDGFGSSFRQHKSGTQKKSPIELKAAAESAAPAAPADSGPTPVHPNGTSPAGEGAGTAMLNKPPVPQPAPAAQASGAAQPAQSPANADVPRFVELEQELARFRSLAEMQKQMLELKEARIRDVEEQRNWLKGRLEKLEEKAERDQLLLLAESQTVRKLISIQEQKKSPVRLMLEWLGITGPEQKRETIEIDHRPGA